MHFDAASASSPPANRLSTRRAMPTMARLREAPRLGFAPYSICGSTLPLVAPLRKRPTRVAFRAGGPAHRVWLPSQRPDTPNLGNLFQSPTLLGFTLRSFAPSRWSRTGFPIPSPFSRFRTRPRSLIPAPQRLHPTEPAVPLFASRAINPGQGRLAPLGFRPFGFSRRRAEEKASLFLHPLSLFPAADVSILCSLSPRGYTLNGLALSLRGGRRPVWPFSPTVARHPLRR